MKIAVAQTRPVKGDVEKNISAHKELASLAHTHGANAVFFPELSLTGYEPDLAKELAANKDDPRFDGLQQLSDKNNMIIAAGMPTNSDAGILISMIIFQPLKSRLVYSKQYLHEDEFPFFINGKNQALLTVGSNVLSPAICYESLLPEHAQQAFEAGANIYVSSVAKTANGVEKTRKHFPLIAAKYSMPVLMSNCVGHCDNFESAGQSAVWDSKGILLGELDDKTEAVLIFDTITEEIVTSIRV